MSATTGYQLDPFAGDPDREVRRGASECRCGHLRASHRTDGCVALVGGPGPSASLCGCRAYREETT